MLLGAGTTAFQSIAEPNRKNFAGFRKMQFGTEEQEAGRLSQTFVLDSSMIEVTHVIPSPDEYNALRRGTGWPTYETIAAETGLRNSLHTVCVRDGGELIAFGRVVGDGIITFYIQDVIVTPKRQKQGYARIVMEDLMHYLKTVAAPGSVVGLMSARGVERLYEKFGFVGRPHGEKMGAGMVLLEI